MKNQPNVDYIPIDRNHLAMQMGSNTRREAFTRDDFEDAMVHINLALHEHPIVLPGLKYANELYPIEATTILQLSRTSHWPGYEPDVVLEKCLTIWLERKIDDPNIYSVSLLRALEELDCLEGVYLRLNFDAVAQPEISSVRITTPLGTTTQKREPRKSVLMGAARKRIREFLKGQQKYSANLNPIYSGLQRIYQTYDLEQSLLSWMGYLVVRSVANTSQPVIAGNQLLIAQQPKENSSPTPNSPTPEI
jgi:hypothetical protein